VSFHITNQSNFIATTRRIRRKTGATTNPNPPSSLPPKIWQRQQKESPNLFLFMEHGS